MMNMKILAALTPPYIYHVFSTWNTLWEEKFTGQEKFTLGEFSSANMKNCGHFNIRKHKFIKGSDKYVTLNISLKLYSLDKMIISSLEPKVKLGRSGNGLITSLNIRSKTRPNQYKKARHVIGNVSKKDLSKIIRDFEKLSYESYDKKRPKHEPTDS